MGYGDIHATTDGGYGFMMCAIIIAYEADLQARVQHVSTGIYARACQGRFVLVPMQASQLIALVESRQKFGGRFVISPIPHVVVIGRLGISRAALCCARLARPRNFGRAGAETVSEFFTEFNHISHNSNERVVFMSPGKQLGV